MMMHSCSIKVKLYPNQHMKRYLDLMCNYRRYCWNQGLETWNHMYDCNSIDKGHNSKPNEREIRNELVFNKFDWQYQYSARILQLAIKDLGHAFKAFFDKKQPDFKHPRFKSKKWLKQGFKTDRAKIIDGKLRLDRASGYPKNLFYDIRLSGLRPQPGQLKMVAITMQNHQYTANLQFTNLPDNTTIYTNQKTAVDVNVGHFNYTNGDIKTYGHKLKRLYEQNKYYQRLLARKRTIHPKTFRKSNNYMQVRTKLQRNYTRIKNFQDDILHKFTNKLVQNYDQIVIENLDVKHMFMSHVASKGMQRSMFGKFRQYLTYKCQWYGKQLILADQSYPSTQRCSKCGYIKKGTDKITLKGNQKHHTNHHQFICYHCGFKADRDDNAVQNLLALIQ